MHAKAAGRQNPVIISAVDPLQPFMLISSLVKIMTKTAALLFVLVALCDISSADVFSDAYDELMDYDDVSATEGHAGFWWPIGAEYGPKRHELTAEESSDLEDSLNTCVADLRKGETTPPTRLKSVAAALIVQCMNEKGRSLRFLTYVSPPHFREE